MCRVFAVQGTSALLSDSSSAASGQRAPRDSQWASGVCTEPWDSDGPRSAVDESAALQDVPLQLPMWMGWRDETDSSELFFASIHGVYRHSVGLRVAFAAAAERQQLGCRGLHRDAVRREMRRPSLFS